MTRRSYSSLGKAILIILLAAAALMVLSFIMEFGTSDGQRMARLEPFDAPAPSYPQTLQELRYETEAEAREAGCENPILIAGREEVPPTFGCFSGQ